MKYENLLKRITDCNLATLPPDIRKEYHENEEFRAEFEKLRSVQQLMTLKRHEQPDRLSEERILKGIRRNVRMKNTRVTPGEKAWSFCTRFLFPSVGYGTAALTAGFFSVHMMFASQMPAVGNLSWESEFTRPMDVTPAPAAIAVQPPVRDNGNPTVPTIRLEHLMPVNHTPTSDQR
ncbi:MAG: hypothetical protein AAF492_05170 [Verrucomicrobiota bacterium]